MKLGTVTQNGVQADEHVTAHPPRLTVVKGYDIRIVVMSKELLVHLQDTVIVTEDIVQITYLPALIRGGNFGNPCPYRLSIQLGHLYVFSQE